MGELVVNLTALLQALHENETQIFTSQIPDQGIFNKTIHAKDGAVFTWVVDRDYFVEGLTLISGGPYLFITSDGSTYSDHVATGTSQLSDAVVAATGGGIQQIGLKVRIFKGQVLTLSANTIGNWALALRPR